MPSSRLLASFALALLPLGSQPREVRLEPVQPELFAATGSLVNAFADVDRDGDADLFVGFNGPANRLYRNDRGAFVEIGAAAGVADSRGTRAAAFGDWDADGDPDLLVGFAPGPAPVLRLYRNDDGKFTDASASAGLKVDSGAVRQLAWIDYDADDDLDLFVAFRDRANRLYANDRGRLTNVAEEIGLADTRRSVGASWADLDADGDLDLVVANMDGDANGVYRNDAGRFTDVAASLGLEWGGRAARDPSNGTVRPCIADVDGNGRWDLIFANYGPSGLSLQDPAGRFSDAGTARGLGVDGRYDTCATADFDNDGALDIYLNGTVTQGRNWPDYLYRNAGAHFEDVIPASLSGIAADHGAFWADVDRDGALDLALTGQGPHALLRNVLADSVARRSIQVRVLDKRGHATRAGAEVRVYESGTRRLVGMRLVDSGSGYDAQSDLPVHVGVGAVKLVDVEVAWPAAGTRRVVTKSRVRVRGVVLLELRI